MKEQLKNKQMLHLQHKSGLNFLFKVEFEINKYSAVFFVEKLNLVSTFVLGNDDNIDSIKSKFALEIIDILNTWIGNKTLLQKLKILNFKLKTLEDHMTNIQQKELKNQKCNLVEIYEQYIHLSDLTWTESTTL